MTAQPSDIEIEALVSLIHIPTWCGDLDAPCQDQCECSARNAVERMDARNATDRILSAGYSLRNDVFEEAAKVADENAKSHDDDEWGDGARSAAEQIAAAIRALRKEPP